LRFSRRDDKKNYIWNIQFGVQMKEFMPSEKSLVSEVPRVRSSNGGTFKKLKKLCSGARSHPYFGSSNGTFDKSNKRPCSDLVFWIAIRTIPNSWELKKYTLKKFSTGIRPPLYILKDHGRLRYPTHNRQRHIYYTFYPLFSHISLFLILRRCYMTRGLTTMKF
jgi:hypothetical protein